MPIYKQERQEEKAHTTPKVGWKHESVKTDGPKRLKMMELRAGMQLISKEPQLTLGIKGTPVKFLVHINATYLALNTTSDKFCHMSSTVMEVLGKAQEQAFTEPAECKLGNHMLTYSILMSLNDLYPCWGRYLT